jgi:hypothetical protein
MNFNKILGATCAVAIPRGLVDNKPLTLVLHVKLDATTGRHKAAWQALVDRETAVKARRAELMESAPRLTFLDENGLVGLSAEEQDAFADYVASVLSAFEAAPRDGLSVAEILDGHRSTLAKFADRLRVPKLTKKQIAELKKFGDKHSAEMDKLDDEENRILAEKLCFLVDRAEAEVGEGKDAVTETIEGWGVDGVAELGPSSFAEIWDAVAKKALARWQTL